MSPLAKSFAGRSALVAARRDQLSEVARQYSYGVATFEELELASVAYVRAREALLTPNVRKAVGT